MKLAREQALVWLYVPEHLTEKGLTPEQPTKAFEDCNDAVRMVTADWGAAEAAKTREEKREDSMPEKIQLATIAELPPAEQPRAYATRDLWQRVRAADAAQAAPRQRRPFVNKFSFIGRKR